MENNTPVADKAPVKKEMTLPTSSFASFKPTLKPVSAPFVPTSAPKVEFSPVKTENPNKAENLSVVPMKFDLNAPVWTPPNFVPSAAPAPKKK